MFGGKVCIVSNVEKEIPDESQFCYLCGAKIKIDVEESSKKDDAKTISKPHPVDLFIASGEPSASLSEKVNEKTISEEADVRTVVSSDTDSKKTNEAGLNRNRKKWGAILAVVFVIACICVAIFSNIETTKWRVKEGVLYVNGNGEIPEKDIEVDSSQISEIIIEKGITVISDNAFSGFVNVTSISIPDSVTKIGSRAFSNCKNLQEIVIPDSVNTIGERAFEYCLGLRNVVIPKSVTSIEEYAFHQCSSLVSIEIPDSINTIGKKVFSECDNLKEVHIPNTVTNIEDSAFSKCAALEEITIPSTVSSVGSNAFAYCEKLRKVNIDDATDVKANSFMGTPFAGSSGSYVPYGINEGNSLTQGFLVEQDDWIYFIVLDNLYKQDKSGNTYVLFSGCGVYGSASLNICGDYLYWARNNHGDGYVIDRIRTNGVDYSTVIYDAVECTFICDYKDNSLWYVSTDHIGSAKLSPIVCNVDLDTLQLKDTVSLENFSDGEKEYEISAIAILGLDSSKLIIDERLDAGYGNYYTLLGTIDKKTYAHRRIIDIIHGGDKVCNGKEVYFLNDTGSVNRDICRADMETYTITNTAAKLSWDYNGLFALKDNELWVKGFEMHSLAIEKLPDAVGYLGNGDRAFKANVIGDYVYYIPSEPDDGSHSLNMVCKMLPWGEDWEIIFDESTEVQVINY